MKKFLSTMILGLMVSIAAFAASNNVLVREDLVLPIVQNTSGKVQIQTVGTFASSPFNSYIVSSISGENFILDPAMMPSKDLIDLKPVAIVSTHADPDHIDINFYHSYDCIKGLLMPGDSFKTKDFHYYNVLSSHKVQDSTDMDIKAYGKQNLITVLEVNGLRIAHMGDVAQTQLTEKQLKEIGPIDIAFMIIETPYGGIDLKNQYSFKMLEQLNPKIVIPTHYSPNAFAVIEEKYGKIKEYDNIFQISKEELPKTTLNFVHITNTHKYK